MTPTENKTETETEKSTEPAAKVAPIRARRGVRPRQQAPELAVRMTDGTTWRLADAHPRTFTMVVFYRGSHCPVCRAQLSELNRRLDELAERGVDVIAISGDSEEVAAKTTSSTASTSSSKPTTRLEAKPESSLSARHFNPYQGDLPMKRSTTRSFGAAFLTVALSASLPASRP
jgi:hypothetical protein